MDVFKDDLTSTLIYDSLNMNVVESRIVESDEERMDENFDTCSLYNPKMLLGIGNGPYNDTPLMNDAPTNPPTNNLSGLSNQIGQHGDQQQLETTNPDLHPPFVGYRLPRESIIVIGGWAEGYTSSAETYDCKTCKWSSTPQLDVPPRAYHGMVWHERKVYIVGGCGSTGDFSEVLCFDSDSQLWENCEDMHISRCYVSCATHGGYIYAMGGFGGYSRHKSCERFDPAANSWTFISDMNDVRSDACAATLNGKIYIAGGYDGTRYLDSVEFYDPSTNEWMMISGLNGPRSGPSMAALHSHIYVIGGNDGNDRIATVERYDPHSRKWMLMSPMQQSRSNFATVIFNGCIYAIGGYEGPSVVSSVEAYNPFTDSWNARAELNLARSALAACAVTDTDSVDR